jgi:sulfur relay (sulfurtransferase) DsrF/TusC family protein
MAKTLSICDQGYRATVEEQDDTIVWITHMLRKSETDTGLLLRGTAVNYGSRRQEPVAVEFGDWVQRHPANLARDLERFIADGGRVYASEDDLRRYGVAEGSLVDGVTPVDWAAMVELVADHDFVFHW